MVPGAAASKQAMRYLALATDYDGTLATHGRVDGPSIAALRRLLASGRKLLLVTGRHLPDLKQVFPQLDLFHRVVAENGALLYRPQSNEEQLLCEPPPAKFLGRLRQRGIPFSAGRGIVATREPHQETVLEIIRELGLELQVIFNKGAVMVLPSGTNKSSGLNCALQELKLSPHNVVGIGDAENDHAFLAACECGVAVANALPLLKERADIVTGHSHGAGVAEIIDQLIANDLAPYDSRLARHRILLGARVSQPDMPVYLPARGSVLIAGPSGSGKSTVATGILERLASQQYQFCLVDPEGDYENFTGVIALGTATNPPSPTEVIKALESSPTQNIAVNLLALRLHDRPQFFAGLLPRIQELRSRTARPHWVIVDEAHHLLPSSWVPAAATVPQRLDGLILITVHPDHVARPALNEVDMVIAVGREPRETLRAFTSAVGEQAPAAEDGGIENGQALVWCRRDRAEAWRVRPQPSSIERRRHLRKYAEGELPEDRSFYFSGPDGKLKLRAQNLALFRQLADGVDDETWMFHLKQGDYSRWFRQSVKDADLAREVEAIEQDQALSARESRARVAQAIEQRYTAAV